METIILNFFHISTLISRRINKIETKMNDDGNWVHDREELKNMATCFYLDLFASDPYSGGDFVSGQFPRIKMNWQRA